MSRKTWLTLAIAAVVAVAIVAPAYASIGSPSYLTWDSMGGTNPETPHGGYATTTNKCAVCHAVHNASSVLGTELLLRSSVAEACTYCHVGGGGGYTEVYGGEETNYSGADLPNAHNFFTSGGSTVTCTQCHQVHAAQNAMTANTYLSDRLLIGTDLDADYDTLAGAPLASGDSSDTALTKWCTRCHDTALSAGKSYYNGYDYVSGGMFSYSIAAAHVMTTATANYSMPDGSTRQIAWEDSTQCSSCHAAGYTTSDWPHYTPGAARFLLSSGGDTSPTAGAADSTDDGVCLRCHRDGAGAGIGMDF